MELASVESRLRRLQSCDILGICGSEDLYRACQALLQEGAPLSAAPHPPKLLQERYGALATLLELSLSAAASASSLGDGGTLASAKRRRILSAASCAASRQLRQLSEELASVVADIVRQQHSQHALWRHRDEEDLERVGDGLSLLLALASNSGCAGLQLAVLDAIRDARAAYAGLTATREDLIAASEDAAAALLQLATQEPRPAEAWQQPAGEASQSSSRHRGQPCSHQLQVSMTAAMMVILAPSHFPEAAHAAVASHLLGLLQRSSLGLQQKLQVLETLERMSCAQLGLCSSERSVLCAAAQQHAALAAALMQMQAQLQEQAAGGDVQQGRLGAWQQLATYLPAAYMALVIEHMSEAQQSGSSNSNSSSSFQWPQAVLQWLTEVLERGSAALTPRDIAHTVLSRVSRTLASSRHALRFIAARAAAAACEQQAVAAAAAVLNVVVQHTAADAWSLVGEAVLSLAQKVWGGEHSAETQASSSSAAAAAAAAAHQGQQEVPAEVVSCMVTFCSNINKDCPQEQLQARTQQLAQLMALASRAGTWRVVERAQAVLQELLNSPSHSSGIVDLAAGGQQGIIAVLCQTLLAAASAAAAADQPAGMRAGNGSSAAAAHASAAAAGADMAAAGLSDLLEDLACTDAAAVARGLADASVIEHLLQHLAGACALAAAVRADPDPRVEAAAVAAVRHRVLGALLPLCNLRAVASQALHQGGATQLIWQMLQNNTSPEIFSDPDIQEDAQVLWAAAALHDPALIAAAGSFGHTAMERHIASLAFPRVGDMELATIRALRWLVDNDDCFLRSQQLSSILAGPVHQLLLHTLPQQLERELPGCRDRNASLPFTGLAVELTTIVHEALLRGAARGAHSWAQEQPLPGRPPQPQLQQLLSDVCVCTADTLLRHIGAGCSPGRGEAGAPPAPLLKAAQQVLQSLHRLYAGCAAEQARGRISRQQLEDALGAAAISAPLWHLLSQGTALSGGQAGSALQSCAAQLLAILLRLELPGAMQPQYARSGPVVRCLANMLRQEVAQQQQQQQQQQQPTRMLACAACLEHIARESIDTQLCVLEHVHVLPAVGAMLAQPAPADQQPQRQQVVLAALQLLEALVTSQHEVQQLVAGHAHLLQALLALLQPATATGAAAAGDRNWAAAAACDTACEQARVELRALVLLRMVVQDNTATQLALARAPGAAAALLQLLGSAESELANEAAETLAALQKGSSEAQRLVREVSKHIPVNLGID